jgi:hypothetical protein
MVKSRRFEHLFESKLTGGDMYILTNVLVLHPRKITSKMGSGGVYKLNSRVRTKAIRARGTSRHAVLYLLPLFSRSKTR